MAKLNLTDEQRRERSERMKIVRAKHYESLTEEQKFAFRSKGGKSVKNRHSFDSDTARKAAIARWGKGDEV